MLAFSPDSVNGMEVKAEQTEHLPLCQVYKKLPRIQLFRFKQRAPDNSNLHLDHRLRDCLKQAQSIWLLTFPKNHKPHRYQHLHHLPSPQTPITATWPSSSLSSVPRASRAAQSSTMSSTTRNFPSSTKSVALLGTSPSPPPKLCDKRVSKSSRLMLTTKIPSSKQWKAPTQSLASRPPSTTRSWRRENLLRGRPWQTQPLLPACSTSSSAPCRTRARCRAASSRKWNILTWRRRSKTTFARGRWRAHFSHREASCRTLVISWHRVQPATALTPLRTSWNPRRSFRSSTLSTTLANTLARSSPSPTSTRARSCLRPPDFTHTARL